MLKGFKILNAKEELSGLIEYKNKGALKGYYLGFPRLHEYYSMSLPGCTDWTGFPGSGKSEILLELLLNTSGFYDWKHLLYVPDVGDKYEIIGLLMFKKTGKTFDMRYQNKIDDQTIINNLDWILTHFKILTKDDLKAKITPIQFWDLCGEICKTEKIHTCVIDSWKDMQKDRSIRDDQFLEDALSYRNEISEKLGIHIHTVIHPSKTEKDSSGKRPAPGPYDLKGGSEWYNSGKMMVTIHRTDGTSNEVSFIVSKVKPKTVGKLGVHKMYLDLKTYRYYELNGDVKLYASKNYEAPVQLKAFEAIQEDDDGLPF